MNDILHALSNGHAYLYAVMHAFMRRTLAFFINISTLGEIENVINKELVNMCKWFVDNKLQIHFWKDKPNAFFSIGEKILMELSITYNNNIIKQVHIVQYLGC